MLVNRAVVANYREKMAKCDAVKQLCRERIRQIYDQIRGLQSQYYEETEKFEKAGKDEKLLANLIRFSQ